MYNFLYARYVRWMAIPVHPASDARRDLAKYLKAFRESPADAEPIVLGPHRKAEAVLLPIEQYRAMLDRIEELTARAEIADVLSRDSGQRGDVAQLARDHGFDPSDFGLE
jgi:PHD/YefM family antitoxin component YafN of YafNO toxin-antitoxin module